MYPIEFEDNEQIEMTDDHATLLEDDKEKEVCIVVTNIRLFLFTDGNKNMDSREVLRIVKAASYLPSYDKLLEVELSFLDSVEDNKYILKNGNYFYLNSDLITTFLKERLWN